MLNQFRNVRLPSCMRSATQQPCVRLCLCLLPGGRQRGGGGVCLGRSNLHHRPQSDRGEVPVRRERQRLLCRWGTSHHLLLVFAPSSFFCDGHRHSSNFRLMRRRATQNFPTVDLNLQLCPTYNVSFSSLLNVTHLKTSRWGVFGFHVNSLSSVLMVSLRQRE